MSAARRSLVASGALLAVLLAITLVFATPFCGALHRCGCAAPWSGGEARCNYQDATGPHCPWCEHRALGAAVVACALGAQTLAFALARRRGRGRTLAAALALGAAPLAGLVAGALAWAATDYPHFLVRDARARLGLPRGPIPTYATGGEKDGGCCAPRPGR